MRSASRFSLGLILLGLATLPTTSRAAGDPAVLSERDHYNQGVALYRTQQFEQSADAFRQAAAASDPSLAAKARFNLGNADYARAVAAIDSQDPSTGSSPVPTAIESLRAAIESYRSALRITSNDDDARFNLELASKLLRQLEKQQEEQNREQEQKGEQENPQEHSGEPQSEQQDKQESEQENEPTSESSPGENQQGEGENQESQQNQQADEGSEDSKEQQSQEQSGGSESETQDDSAATSQPANQNSDAENRPNGQSSEDPTSEDPTTEDPMGRDNADESQLPPGDSEADQLKDDRMSEQNTGAPVDPPQTPEGELTAANGSETDQEAADESEGPYGQPLRMTQEEARKMLQAIRDRDMLRRLRRQAAQRARQIPVERDW